MLSGVLLVRPIHRSFCNSYDRATVLDHLREGAFVLNPHLRLTKFETESACAVRHLS